MSDSAKYIVEFTLVYNRNKRKIYNYALKLLGDKMLCEDLVQNVFLKFYTNMDRIRNNDRVEVWLFKTLRNEIYTIFRTRHSRADTFNAKDSDELEIESSVRIDEETEYSEMDQLIMNELNGMAFEQREVFLLKEYGGFSYREIAEVMNINEDLVKSRLFKTRRKLIEKLSKVLK